MHLKVSIHKLKGPTAAALYLDDTETSHGMKTLQVSCLFMMEKPG